MYQAYISFSPYDALEITSLCFSYFILSDATGDLSLPMKALPYADLMRAELTILGLPPRKHLLL